MSNSFRFSFSCILGLGILGVCLLQACAQIVAPTGGDPDEDPPVMDTLRSTENFQTNFKKQDLVFYFDEWVELKNPKEQVIISPVVNHSDYSLSIKKKSIVFSFNEDFKLKEDITYIINFGDAVADFTEGNPVPNMRYVFSTGSVIDSLSFEGNVKDVVTGKPVEDAVVILNDNLSDTAFAKIDPLYIFKTDENGNFQLENLKSDTFQVCVLLNSSNGYKYDPLTTTSFGFLDSVIVLDTSRIRPVQLWMSNPVPPLSMNRANIEQLGRIAIGYNRPPNDVEVSATPPRKELYSKVIKDSLIVWYSNAEKDTAEWNLLLQKDTIDTINIVPRRLKTNLNFDLEPQISIPSVQQTKNPFDTFRIMMNYPISEIDESLINITKDSVEIEAAIDLTINPNDRREVISTFAFSPGSNYKIQILPAALLSLYATVNDTIELDLKMLTAEDLSNFNLNISNLDSLSQYLFSFKDDSGKLIDQQTVSNTTTLKLAYKYLNPVEYSATIVLDRNANGQWDGGDFELKRQPEKITVKEFGKLLANFDRTEDWQVKKLE